MLRSSLLVAILAAAPGLALAETHDLVWDVRVDGKVIGQRAMHLTLETEGTVTVRTIEATTELAVSMGPVQWSYKQRLTAFADTGPAAFQAVMLEDGAPREVQARWRGDGWTVSIADKKSSRTYEAGAYRIDLSTVDLFDPSTRLGLGRFSKAKVLSAETGDIWEGEVEPLGPSTVKVGNTDIAVQGYAWTSPEGRSTFWYDAGGWLVKYETRVLGRPVEGLLRLPPPGGPDTFQVDADAGPVQSVDL